MGQEEEEEEEEVMVVEGGRGKRARAASPARAASASGERVGAAFRNSDCVQWTAYTFHRGGAPFLETSSRFSGFRSRCTIPRACKCFRARAI